MKAISHTSVYLARPFIRHAHIIVFYFPECFPPTSTSHILLLLFSLNLIIIVATAAAAAAALYGREEREKRGMHGGEFEGVFARVWINAEDVQRCKDVQRCGCAKS